VRAVWRLSLPVFTDSRPCRGYKFDSGGLRVRGTHEVVPTMMEKDVFRALKLKYIRTLEFLGGRDQRD
jgi:hypothetical protein